MIRFESGDFPEGSIGKIDWGVLRVLDGKGEEIASYREITSVEKLESKAKHNWGRKAAVGVTAGLLTGGVGLLAGAVVGNSKEMAFIIKLPDGKSGIGTGTNKDYENLCGLIKTGWGLQILAFLIVVGIPMAVIISCVT